MPLSASAAISAPWNATSTDKGYISPNLINGNNPNLYIAALVGIGTKTPSDVNANARLTVAGISSQDIIASTTDNTTLSDAILQAYAPGARVFLGAHGTNQVSTRYGITLGGWGELGAFNSTSGTINGLIIGTNPAVPLVFGTNNVERARFLSSGLFGIGTTTPSQLLSVQGNELLSGDFASANVTATGTLTLSALTGTQCLHEVSGVVSGTGSDCGSGSGTGLSTTSPVSAGNLLEYSSAGAGSAFGIATSTPTVTAPITYSGTLGAFVGGISGAFNCAAATGSVAGCLSAADWTTFNNKGTVNSVGTNNGLTGGTITNNGTIGLATISNGVLGAVVGGTVPIALATSTLYGRGADNTVLAEIQGIPTWVATTTFSSGLTYSGGNVTNTGVTSIIAGTNITISGATGAVTINATGGGTGTPGGASSTIQYNANGAFAGANIFTNGSTLGVNTVPGFAALEVMGTTSGSTANALTAWNSSLTNLFTVRNDGNVGIGTSSPFAPLSIVGTTTQWGSYAHFGTTYCNGSINSGNAYTGQSLELCGSDNSDTGGVQIQVGNNNAGANAFAGFTINDDRADTSLTKFTGLYMNSSGYSSATFGTAFAIPYAALLQNSLGSLSLVSSTSTAPTMAYINAIVGGTNTGNEIWRTTTKGLGIGTTTPQYPLTIDSATTQFDLVLDSTVSGIPTIGWIDKFTPSYGANSFNTGIWTWMASSTAAGLTNAYNSQPIFKLDESAAGSQDGVSITSRADPTGPLLAAIGVGTNIPLNLSGKGTGSVILTANANSTASITSAQFGVTVAAGSKITATAGQTIMAQSAATAAATQTFLWSPPNESNLTTLLEHRTYQFSGTSQSHAAGAIAGNSDVIITPFTQTFTVGASVVNSTIASSTQLALSPAIQGAIVNLTNVQGLYIGTQVYTSASTTNAFGMVIQAPTGATTNGAASTTGNWIMHGLAVSSSGDALCLNATTNQVEDAGGATCIVSTEHAKHDIQPIGQQEALNVLNWKPVSYILNETGVKHYGFIAEDMAKVDPTAVEYATKDTTVTGPDGKPYIVKKGEPLTVSYGPDLGAVVALVQYQQTQIENLSGGVQKAKRAVEENWQDGLIALLLLYMLYNEFDKRRNK